MSRWRLNESRLGWTLFLLALLGIGLLPVPPFWLTQANYMGIGALVAIGLVLLTGVAGMTSFGQAAFVGVSAYTSATLVLSAGVSPWLALPVAVAVTLALALVLGVVTLRLSGHFLPLGTLAWALALFYLFSNSELLGKFDGLSGLPSLQAFGFGLGSGQAMFWLIWLCVALGLLASANLLDSRTGRAIRALNEGEVMAESCGIHTARYRLVVFLVAAALAAVAGWLYAFLQRGVNPTPFHLNAGIEYLFMVVLGGAASLWGAVTGAVAFTVVKDQLQRYLPQLVGQTGNFEIILFGLLIILLLQRSPKGLWPLLTQGLIARWAPGSRALAPPSPADPLPRRAMPERASLLLDVKGMSKRFGGLLAVNRLALQVRAGEIVALIGPNGAGKSTSFNMISGVLTPSDGEIHLHHGMAGSDARIDRLASREIARRGVARTFQHVKLLPGMTVLDNVMIGAYQRGSAGLWRSVLRLDRADEARLRAEALKQIERVGLGAHALQAADSLALGQQRIVEIARALASDPVLLLLDEPAAGLRHQEKLALARLLRQLRAEGMSVLFVEHDMDFVMGLADQVFVMSFGAPISRGTPAQVVADPAVLDAYLGSAT